MKSPALKLKTIAKKYKMELYYHGAGTSRKQAFNGTAPQPETDYESFGTIPKMYYIF